MAETTHEFPRSIGKPATHALLNQGITTLKQLTRFSEQELLAMHGMGPKAIGILKNLLAEKGWSLAAGKK
jgi:Bacterial RNA polymerase, alpha chain C terminal domain.